MTPVPYTPPASPIDLEAIFGAILDFFTGRSGAHFPSLLISLYRFLWVLFFFFSMILLTLIGYVFFRAYQARRAIYLKEKAEEEAALAGGVAKKQPKNRKWDLILEHSSSNNPSDWRLAILEADIVLDELLEHLGYHGQTIGDKLKAVVPGDFRTLNQAWEAHKIRNTIAHEGSDFLISHREARRVVSLYREVFEEFKFI